MKAAQALEYVHSKNIYYGDMKEANLLITKDYLVKLGNFELAIKLNEKPVESSSEAHKLKGMTE